MFTGLADVLCVGLEFDTAAYRVIINTEPRENAYYTTMKPISAIPMTVPGRKHTSLHDYANNDELQLL